MSDVDAYRRLVRLCASLRVTVLHSGHPADTLGGTWAGVAELAASPEAVEAAVNGEAARIRAEHGYAAPRHVAASTLLHRHLWSASLLVSGPWYLTGRVPRTDPARLWTAPATGELALLPADAGDSCDPPAPQSPRAVRAAVSGLTRPLLAAFGPLTRRGPRALRGMADDDLVSGIWHLGRESGEEARAVALAEALVPGVGFRTLRGASGRAYATRTRAGCCLAYMIRPADICLTCPRLGDCERLRRLEAAAVPAVTG